MYLATLGALCLLAIGLSQARPSRSHIEKSSLGIIGGKNASIKDFPYMVSLRLDDGIFAGSGAIVNEHWIITTAWNLIDTPVDRFRLRVGSDHFLKGGQTLKISKVVNHPKFRETEHDYDLAAVKTSAPIKFNQNVKSIPLGQKELKAGQKGKISGWGYDETWQYVNSLKQTEVTVYDRKQCATSAKSFLTKRLFCTFDTDTEAFGEDFGDPLVVDGELYGLFSWNVEWVIPPTTPSLYVNLPKLRDWVMKVTKV